MLGNFKYRYITVSNAYEPLPDILLKEGDVNGRGLKIQFSDSGEVIDLTEYAVDLECLHLDTNIAVTTPCKKVETGLYVVGFPNEVLTAGAFLYQIKVYSDKEQISLNTGRAKVQGNVIDKDTVAGSFNFEGYEAKLAELQGYKGELQQFKTDIQSLESFLNKSKLKPDQYVFTDSNGNLKTRNPGFASYTYTVTSEEAPFKRPDGKYAMNKLWRFKEFTTINAIVVSVEIVPGSEKPTYVTFENYALLEDGRYQFEFTKPGPEPFGKFTCHVIVFGRWE